MREERLMILRMVSEGKLSPEQAERLLDALGSEKKPRFTGFDVPAKRKAKFKVPLSEIDKELRRHLDELEENLAHTLAGLNLWQNGPAPQAERQFERTIPFTPDQLLTLKNTAGDVKVQPGTQESAEIQAHIRVWAASREQAQTLMEQVHIHTEGTTITTESLIPSPPHPRCQVRVDYTLTVPQQIDLDLTTKRGIMDIEGINGAIRATNRRGKTRIQEVAGELDIHSERGSLRITGVQGPIRVTNRGGEVEIKRSQAGSITLFNHRGKVRLEQVDSTEIQCHRGVLRIEGCAGLTGQVDRSTLAANQLGGDLHLQARGSILRLSEVKGPLALDTRRSQAELRNVQGGIQLRARESTVAIEQPGGAIDCEAHRSSLTVRCGKVLADSCRIYLKGGSLTFLMPEEGGVDLTAEIKNGNLSIDPALRGALDLEREEGKRHTRRITAQGRLRGGGTAIWLQVQRGEISLLQ